MIKRLWQDYSLFIVLLFLLFSFLTIWTVLNPVYTPLTIWLGVIVALFSILAILVTKYVHMSGFSVTSDLLSKDRYIFVFLCVLTVIPRLIYSFLIYPFPSSNAEDGNVILAGLIASKGLFNYFDFRFFTPWNVRERILKQPPLFVIFLSGFFYVFGPDLQISRLVMIIVSSIPVFFTFLIGKELFERNIGLIAAILFSCFPHYFLLSIITSIDMLLIVFYMASIYTFIRFVNGGEKTRDIIFFIIVTSLGLLVKYPMLLIYPTLFFTILLEKKTAFLKNQKVWMAGILPLMVLCCWLAILWYNGLLGRVLRSIFGHFLTDYKQVSTIAPSASVPMFLGNILLGVGLLNMILSLSSLMYDLREIIRNNSLILAWSFVPLLFFLFTYRDCGYVFPAYPGFSFLCAAGVTKFVKRENAKYLTFLLCIISSFAILSIWTYMGLYVVVVDHHIYYYTGLDNFPAGLR